MNILEVHEQMMKEAEVANEQQELIDFFAKYATAAEELLSEQGDNYSEEDVIKVASYLIDRAVEEQESLDKVAEWDNNGRMLAQSFYNDLN